MYYKTKYHDDLNHDWKQIQRARYLLKVQTIAASSVTKLTI